MLETGLLKQKYTDLDEFSYPDTLLSYLRVLSRVEEPVYILLPCTKISM
jgi:hypothetical protein